MPSTYSSRLRLELMASGEQSGSWGTKTNTNLGTLIEEAIAGYESIATGDADVTLSTANGATDQARKAMLRFTGTLTANRNIIVPTSSKIYFIDNSCSGAFSLVVKTASGSGVTIPNGSKAVVYCDGTNVLAANAIDYTKLHPFTGNISINAGAAGTPSLYFSGDSNTGFFSPTADTLCVSTGGVERVRVTSAGRVGVGMTPSKTLDVQGLTSGDYALGVYGHATNGYGINSIAYGTAYAVVGSAANGFAGDFRSTGTHALYARNTSSGGYSIYADGPGSNSYGGLIGYSQDLTKYGIIGYQGWSAYFNAAITATAFTVSDERFKENIENIDNALPMIEALRPVGFDWKQRTDQHNSGFVRSYGFIAQEAMSVLPPECVRSVSAPDTRRNSGDPENPETMTLQREIGEFLVMDNSIVIPFLVRAVQQLSERVKILEGER